MAPLIEYNSVGEISEDQARLDEDDDSSSDSDSALDKTYVSRSHAKTHVTSPRQTRSRTKSVTSIESDSLAGNEIESDYASSSEPDLEDLAREETRSSDTPSTPLQSRTRRRTIYPSNSKLTATSTRHDYGYEAEPDEDPMQEDADSTPRALERKTQRLGKLSLRNFDDSQASAIPSNSQQEQGKFIPVFPGAAETDRITIGAPGQMDVDEVDHRTPLSFQRGITGPKRKSSITHGDSQVMQEMSAMVVVEQQDSQLKILHNKRPRLQSSAFTVTNLFHSKEYCRYRYHQKRMAGLKEKNKRLVEIVQEIQEKEQGMMKEQTEAAEMLRKSMEDANVSP